MAALKYLALLAAIGFTLCQSRLAQADLIGPSHYVNFSDSPFFGGSFSYFYLENFEDLALNTPGVTASGGAVFGPGVLFPTAADSVDADDGAIDGSGSLGHSFGIADGSPTISFTFDATVLGNLPTHVGVVYTDGNNPSFFEAFDASGASLGKFGPFSFFASLSQQVQGDTAEDSFLGFINSGGISRITASNTGGGGLELDHLQYGLGGSQSTVPEPGSLVLGGSWFLAMAVWHCWRKTKIRQSQGGSTEASDS